jgi:DNA-binding transcriptional ArsR family regulator
MKAVYIVNNSKIAKVLIDPMRRAILDLLREKSMTQTQLAKELDLSTASLNYHIKLLHSKRLVTVAKKQIGKHGIVQIFYSGIAYYFAYDLDSLPNEFGRYFYPLSLERARAVISALLLSHRSLTMPRTPNMINEISIKLSRIITSVAKTYEGRDIEQGTENIILEIYNKAINIFIKNYIPTIKNNN